MKNTLILLALLVAFQPFNILHAQNQESTGIQWWGEDEVANDLVSRGLDHLLNIEREMAFTYFNAAVQKDPMLFAPRVVLSWMSDGDTRAYHKIQAQKLVADKNEASKLYVSLMEVGSGEEGREKRRDIWKKMHELAPNGRFIHTNYARTLQDPKEQIAEYEKLLLSLTENDRNSDYVHNTLGYLYYAEGDKAKAKMHFDKYLELRPNGYNAYDSMAEFYRREGDLKNALVYYKKATEKYPAAITATNNIKEIEAELSAEGNLWLVSAESIDPANRQEYIQWGKEYKEVADATNFRSFNVSSENNTFYYAWNVGKTMADLGDFEKEWEDWTKDHTELQTQYDKYKHTVTGMERSLWRHNPEASYQPDGLTSSTPSTYVRTYRAYVKFGHEDAIKDLCKEFKKVWAEKKISTPYNVYWNVFGEEGPCVSFRTAYKDIAAWQAEQKEIEEKIDQAVLSDLMSRWGKHIRKGDTVERFPRPDLSHQNTDAVAGN